jgi:hypothetical protein
MTWVVACVVGGLVVGGFVVGAFVVGGFVVGGFVVVVGGFVVVAGGLVVVTTLNSERSDLEVQPGSLRSTLPSRSLSRPSEHWGLGAEVDVVEETGSVEDVVVESSPKGNLSGVSGEAMSTGA